MLSRLAFVSLVALVALAALLGCGGSSEDVVSLSVSSADSLTPQPGQTVTLTVRSISSDGTSADVTDRATCALSAKDPPGALAGRVFTASKPGTTDVVCSFAGVTGTLGITVPGALKTTVAKIQKGEIQQGTRVEVSGIVFAVDADGRYTNFWVQDPGGGAHSGIGVRDVRKLAPDATGDPRPVAENDVVTVGGTYVERQGRSVINWDTVTKTGTQTPKADAVKLAEVDPAKWDGCLVEVRDVKVSNPEVDEYTWEIVSATDPGAPPLLVDTLLYASTPAKGDSFEIVRGPLYVSEDKSRLVSAIAPRRAEDLVRREGPVSAVTVFDIQAGKVQDGARVTLSALTVTALDPDGSATNLYAQDPAGGKGSGIYLRDERSAPDALQVGDVIDVTGVYTERKGRSVVGFDTLKKTGTRAPKVDTLSLAGLALEDWESALVRVLDVTVTNAAVDDYTWEVGGSLLVDNSLHDPQPVQGDVYAALTGVVWRAATGSVLLPRGAADVGGLSIKEIHAGVAKADALVHVDGAVVFAVRPGPNGVLDLWAQEPGGGARSGIHLRDNRSARTTTIAVGDVISAAGSYALRSGYPVIRFTDVSKTGAGTPVADAVPMATLTAPASAAEWAGCFVKVDAVAVKVADSGGLGFTVVPSSAPGAAALLVGNELTGPMSVNAGQTFTSIRGAVYVTGGAYELWPRAAGDLTP